MIFGVGFLLNFKGLNENVHFDHLSFYSQHRKKMKTEGWGKERNQNKLKEIISSGASTIKETKQRKRVRKFSRKKSTQSTQIQRTTECKFEKPQ